MIFEGIDPDETEAALCVQSLSAFVRRAWREIDPSPLIWNWHLDVICCHLQAVSEYKISKLIINVPPGHAKSMLVSVLWPAWQWIKHPEWSVIFASYEQSLVSRDAVKCRNLMRGEWYTRFFRSSNSPFTFPKWEFSDSQDNKLLYYNTALGFRVSTSVGVSGKSSSTGKRGDALVIDDPMRAADAYSAAARNTVIRWKTETMSSRFNDMQNAQEVIIMQRLHEEDLSGYLLKAGGWQHLCLRSEKTEDVKTFTKDGELFWSDHRTKGELLFPQKFPKSVLDEARSGRGMGRYAYAAQHQQDPAPAEGGLLKYEWFKRRWGFGASTPEVQIVSRPAEFDRFSMWCDAAFKGEDHNDRVAIGVFGTSGQDQFLLDMRWGNMDFLQTLTAIKELLMEYPYIGDIFIEDKANGSAIVSTLKNKSPVRVTPINPEGGKMARVSAISPFIEAGRLILPAHAPWLNDYLHEACTFPKAKHDDAIDMTAYAMLHLCARSKLSALEALARW